MRDWWCERRLFGYENTSIIAEPVSSATGFIMLIVFILLPRMPKNETPPQLFLFVKACLVVLAVGTILFHSITYENSVETVHVNINMFDWLPLVLTNAVLFVLYMQSTFNTLSCTMQIFIYTLIVLWSVFLALSMDTHTYNFLDSAIENAMSWGSILNFILLLPVMSALLYCTWTNRSLKTMWKRLWILLLASLVIWIVNVSACASSNWLAPLHAVYHVIMAYALVYAACLGLSVYTKGEWEIAMNSAYVIAIQRKKASIGQASCKDLFSLPRH